MERQILEFNVHGELLKSYSNEIRIDFVLWTKIAVSWIGSLRSQAGCCNFLIKQVKWLSKLVRNI